MACNLCDLGKCSFLQVMPVGSDNPDIYFVLDKPTLDEQRFNSLLSGSRAGYLMAKLQSEKIDNECRIFSVLRCPSDKDGTDEEVRQCLKFLRADIYKTNPKVIVTLGSFATNALLGSDSKITKVHGVSHDVTIFDKTFKVIPTFSPTYIKDRNDNNARIGFVKDLDTAKKIADGIYISPMERNSLDYALDYKTFYDFYINNLKGEPLLAYDIETNAKLVYSKDFEIVGWSLAKEGVGIYVCLDSLDYHMPSDDKQKCIDLLIEILKETPKIVVHNGLYERPATYFQYGYELPFEKLEDTLVMAKIMLGGKVGAGLKPNAQRIGYPEWDADVAQYVDGFGKAIKRCSLKRNQVIIKNLREGKSFEETFRYLNDPKYDEIEEIYNSIKESVLRYYTEDEADRLMSLASQRFAEGYDSGLSGVISYGWIPQRMLCKYGATDSLATFDLYNYFLEQFKANSTSEVSLDKGYYFDLMEHYTGYELMLAGIHWDDNSATRDYKAYSEMMEKSLRAMLLCNHPVMNNRLLDYFMPSLASPVIYEFYNDYFWEHYKRRLEMKDDDTYVMVDISPKTGKERRRNVKFLVDGDMEIPDGIRRDLLSKILPAAREKVKTFDVEEMKDIFNPGSTLPKNAAIYNDIVMNDDVRVGNFINKIRDNIINSDENYKRKKYSPEEKSLISAIDEYLKVPINDIPHRKELFEPIKETVLSLNNTKSKNIQEYLDDMRSLYLDRLSDECQIEVHNSSASIPMNPDDPATWTDSFKWNFYLRMFKKSSKIKTAYLDGAVGRQSVYAVNKDKLQSGADVVYREVLLEKLGTTDDRGNLPDGDDWLEQTSFGVGTAETGRWRCLSGDTRVFVPDRGEVKIEKLYSEGKPFSVISYDVATGKLVNATCNKVAITGHDTPMVRVTTSQGGHFDCTPEHKILMSSGEYVQAQDLKIGDRFIRGILSVVSVRKISNCQTVYDLSIPIYHNFMLGCDVVVHNSSIHVMPSGSTVKRLYTSRYPGGTIFQPDFSANELRCIASAAHEDNMLEAFREGLDIHKSNASKMFNVPMEEVTPFQRRRAKAVSFLTIYGGSAKALAESSFNGNVKQAQGLLDSFFEAFPKLKVWIDQKQKEVLETHKVSTLTHRFINVDFDANDKKSLSRALRQSANFPIQSLQYDTEVIGLDGKSHKIGELADSHEDLWVYTYDTENHKIIPMKGIQAQCTGTTDTWYKIVLDNEKSVKVTPEHKMMLRDGTYCRADKLKVGQSLMPLYMDEDSKSSENYYGKIVSGSLHDPCIYRKVHKYVYPLVDISDLHVHHIDMNRDNNSPDNLVVLTNPQHIKLHRLSYEFFSHNDKSVFDFVNTDLRNCWSKVYGDSTIADEKADYLIRTYYGFSEKTKSDLAKKSMSSRNKRRSKDYKSWDKNQREAASKETSRRLENTGNVLGMDADSYSRVLSDNWSKNYDSRVEKLRKAHNTSSARKAHSIASKKSAMDPDRNFNMLRKPLLFMVENGLPWSTPSDWDNSVKLYPAKPGRKYSKFIIDRIGWERFQEKAEEYLQYYNHKISSIEVIHLDTPEPKYDLHVPKYHNFALSCGVFTHNSAASTMSAVVFCDILLYMKKNNYKSKGICFIHDSLESDVYPYELIEVTKYQQHKLATGAVDYFGIECKADVSMGYSMGHECEMTDIEVLDDKHTKAYITFDGSYDDILDTINNWKLAYHKVEIVEESVRDKYTPIAEMFLEKKAFDPMVMANHKQGTVKVYVQYYNDRGEIDPMEDHFEPVNIWDNATVYQYIRALNT